jgi:glucose/mannose-6-phosphate isomerase
VVNDLDFDSATAQQAADPSNMLGAIAGSGAQMRTAVSSVNRDVIARAAAEGKPRAAIVAGMGGSGVSGDILAAVAGPSSPIPLTVERTHHLPGWVSPLDVVIAVSCSGHTEETLEVAAEAARRGARLITVAAAGSPLAQIGQSTRGAHHIDVDAQGRMPRASLWTIATPILLLADALGITTVSESDFAVTADFMDELSVECGPVVSTDENPAKLLALTLANSLPVVWGTGAIGRAVSGRFMAQLAENAKMPAIHGGLPEVGHNQIVTFDGIFARFADRNMFSNDEDYARMLSVVMLRDDAEHQSVTARVDVIKQLAVQRNIPLCEVMARGEHRLSRVASLVVPTDWASAYAALAMGIDPSPINPIAELKAGVARSAR